MNESSDTNTSFSLDEIRRQLAALGYENVGAERLEQFQSDLSRLMSRSGGGDTSINTTDTPYHHQFALETSDDDSTIQEPSDATSYNPLPKVNVPREKYIPDDLEKSLDALDGFKLRDPDQFEIHNPVLELSDDESLLTEELINLPVSQISSRKMRRKVARSVHDGSYVTDSNVSSNASLISVTNDTDADSTISELDDELRQRLNKLKINLGLERKPLSESNKRVENRVRFIEEDEASVSTARSTKRPSTAPPRYTEERTKAPSFLRPDFTTKQKSSPIDLYNQYKQTWDRHKTPDGSHDGLRREIRAMCAERENTAVKPGRRITTDYIVPTTKKRQALVWEVRTALHNRQVINK